MTAASSDALLARLLELHPKVIDLSLDRMWRILDVLGNPQDSLPPVIHIAGTNGKGSTQAMIRAGLEAMGKTVHAYTSPHLAQFHERIRLSGELIAETDLAALLAEVETANNGEAITFFEVTTAAAFLAFSSIPADYLILEVGLGGRLDATNVMTPDVTVITPVALDHEAYLGDTLPKIAGEKAGIIKQDVPLFMGIQPDEARDIIEDIANKHRAPITIQNQDFQSYVERGHLIYQDALGLEELPKPALIGAHQIDNAGLSLAVLRHLGAGANALAAAMQNVTWPARMQRLRTGPLFAQADEIWLDGGHNPAAGMALAQALRSLPPKDIVIICGMLNTKDVRGYLAPLADLAPEFYAVSIEGEAATLSAEDTASAARDVGMNAHPASSAADALSMVADAKDKRVLICGSLYLAGRILREHA